MLFKYLTTNGNAQVFALSTDITNVLRVVKNARKPALLKGTVIHEDIWTRNYQTAIATCDSECSVIVDEKVQVTFSGPLTSKAQKIKKLKELLAIAESDEGSSILDGFPAGPNSHFELLATGG